MSPGDATRRAMVTGGAGFVGSHLVKRLVADGWQVLVIDDLSAGSASALPSQAELVVLDVARAPLTAPVARWRPHTVFHLAAQVSVPRSMEDPAHDLRVNVLGTRRVMDAAREAGARRAVFVSSGGAVYGDLPRPASERSVPQPSSYYGVHKLAAEWHVALSGMSHAIVRPSNLYGPGQRSGIDGAVVQAFLSQAGAGGPLVIDGDGEQTRDFVHAVDAVEALVLLAQVGESGTWNLARGRSVSINRLAQIFDRLMGPFPRARRPARRGDVRSSRLSARKLRALGWRPTISLAQGIARLRDGR